MARLRIRFFAGTRDAVGAAAVEVDVRERATLADVFDALVKDHPALGRYRGVALLAVDGRFAPGTTRVDEAREVAIMPPVSGGAGPSLTTGTLDLDKLLGELRRERAGAVASFLGVVRADGGIERLHFEAYDAMAEREIADIVREAIAKFDLVDALVRHRVGDLDVGEPIVAVLASAPHRREAFAAVAWIMDELKSRVPVWKQEQQGARVRWVNDPTV